MQVVILAGGYGTRLSEETVNIPKPMVEIGGKPILWHIMKSYSNYGFNDFVICLGYKGYIIKEYFANYFLHQSDVTFDMKNNTMEIHDSHAEPWAVTLIDTGVDVLTAARVKRVEKYVNGNQFMLTYGDGVSNVNINNLINFHNEMGKLVTLTAVQPAGRFGALKVDDNNLITKFNEKPKGDNVWINGGFFVLEQEVFDYVDDDPQSIWETDVLAPLAEKGELAAYKHHDFWQCMDTMRDKKYLEELIRENNTPWLNNKI